MGSTANTQILAHAERRSTALVWRVAGDAFLQVQAGSREGTQAAPRPPEGIVSDDREGGVVSALCQAQQGVPEFACRVQLGLCDIIPPQPEQDWNKLWRLAHLLTQRVRLGVGLLHLGRSVPFSHLQCTAEGNVHG